MRIAVTGASGFIGRHIANRLIETNHQVFAFGRRERPPTLHPAAVYTKWDITDRYSGTAVDVVVHAAAHVSDWGTNDQFFRTNVHGTRNVMDAFRTAELFIQISSASIYGSPSEAMAGLTEDQITVTTKRSPYGLTKSLAEKVILGSSRPSFVLRPRAVYGEGDNNLLPRILRASKYGHLIAVGNGRNEVSITHINNLVHAVECCLQTVPNASAYNIADREFVRMDELLQAIAAAAGLSTRIFYIPRLLATPLALSNEALSRFAGVFGQPTLSRYAISQLSNSWKLDINRAVQYLRYSPEYDYQDFLPLISAKHKN